MAFRSLSDMDVKAGADAGNAWSATVAFDWSTRVITLEAWSNNMDIRVSEDDITYTDSFEVDPDRPLVLPFQTRFHQHKNETSGAISKYQVAGFV